MVTRLLLIACIISALPLKIHARLGWTLQECRDHYGKETFISEVPPAGPIFQDFHFQVGHFFVGVNFMNNRVGQIYYFKTGSEHGKNLTEDEIKLLLERNGPGVNWKPEGLNGKQHEERFADVKEIYLLWTGFDKDGKVLLEAYYVDDSQGEKPQPTLTINTREYAEARDAGLKEQTDLAEKRRLKEADALKQQQDGAKERLRQEAEKSTEGL
jgi:hypothetical protein